jgi:hypothetical protein
MSWISKRRRNLTHGCQPRGCLAIASPTAAGFKSTGPSHRLYRSVSGIAASGNFDWTEHQSFEVIHLYNHGNFSESSKQSIKSIRFSCRNYLYFSRLRHLECGENMEQALTKGCVYDAMLPAWVPKPCFNSTLYDEYIGADPDLKFYCDSSGVNEVRLSLVETGRYQQLFSSHSYHLQHYFRVWHKQIAIMEPRGAWVEDWVMEWKHARHCAHTLTTHHEHTNRSSATVTQTFQKCRKASLGDHVS